jgi:glucosyl-dolichyl phosphate glucuronosyltransferase
MVLITVVVPSYNGENYIAKCLESLISQTHSTHDYEVIIINNNSTDNTVEIVEKFIKNYPHMKLINEPHQGISFVRNRGYIEAQGDYVAYIDDDCVADINWIKIIHQSIYDVTPQPLVIGGKILPYYNTIPPKWFSNELETFTRGSLKKFLSDNGKEGFWGANMIIKKSILIEYNGFKTEYGMNGKVLNLGEEPELFLRIFKDKPLFWYDPEIIVHHYIKDNFMNLSYRFKRAWSTGRLTYKLYRNNRSKLLFYCISRSIFHSLCLIMFLLTFRKRYLIVKRIQLLISKISCMACISKYRYNPL